VKNAGNIWIQGAGELASGVALRLVRSGYRVLMADLPNPLAVRRLVCFCEAIHEGETRVEGVSGVLLEPDDAVYRSGRVGVVVDPSGTVLARIGAAAVVDARMTKNPPAPLPRGGCPLIGLGPGFTCGVDADLVVETHREAQMGAVLAVGTAARDTGEPGRVGGQTSLRLLRSGGAGTFNSLYDIGDAVEEGAVVGHVGGLPVVAGLSGMIRGLVHRRAELSPGDKVGDVDPRGTEVDNYLVSDKALAVGGGVLEALLRLGVLPHRDHQGNDN
jgi:xanthine dehydrogenase accessory factor